MSLAQVKKTFPASDRLVSLDRDNIPTHVAVIMDGNGRWAREHELSRSEGHEAGVEGVRELITACNDLGVRYLSIFSFSTENWRRPEEEVDGLMSLFAKTLLKELSGLKARHVRLKLIGDVTKIPAITRKVFSDGISATEDDDGMTLIFAVNYGGRQEIVNATKGICKRILSGELRIDEIDEGTFESSLYTAGIPDPDLLIRTSGEQRISNFMLWQTAYSEFYVSDVLWPDFTRYDLLDAVIDYQGRARRFGGIQ